MQKDLQKALPSDTEGLSGGTGLAKLRDVLSSALWNQTSITFPVSLSLTATSQYLPTDLPEGGNPLIPVLTKHFFHHF